MLRSLILPDLTRPLLLLTWVFAAGFPAAAADSGALLDALIRKEEERWRKVIREANIKPE